MIVTLLCQVANRFNIGESLGMRNVGLDVLLLSDIPTCKNYYFSRSVVSPQR